MFIGISDSKDLFPPQGLERTAGTASSDLHLIKTCASLKDMAPDQLLRAISGRSGETAALDSLKSGRRLCAAARSDLERILTDLLNTERQIIAKSCEESSGLAKAAVGFSVLGGFAVLLAF